MARIRLTSTSRPQWRDRGSPQPNKPAVKRNRLGRKSWRRGREGKVSVSRVERKETEAETAHLFKLFHGEHLLGELEDQILPHGAAKHLVKKSQRGTRIFGHIKLNFLFLSHINIPTDIPAHPPCFTQTHTFWTVSWMSALGRVTFSPRSREEAIWRSRR